jgi:hypothetical protein
MVHIYVTKGSPGKLRKLKTEIDGVTIQVNNIGNPTVRPEIAPSASRHGNLYTRNDRIACGSSCAPSGVGYSGTLGGIVRKVSSEELFIISNNHIIAECNHTPVNMPIMAPSTADSRPGIRAPIQIARHREIHELRSGVPDLVPPSLADVAIAVVHEEGVISSWQGDPESGFDTPTDIVVPRTKMTVKKFGRTTGLTHGMIHSEIPAPMAVPYAMRSFTATVWFQDVWTILPDHGDFALPGDSGSLVVTADGNSAVGVIFAVDRQGRSAFMAPMDYVRTLFGGLELVGNHGV